MHRRPLSSKCSGQCSEYYTFVPMEPLAQLHFELLHTSAKQELLSVAKSFQPYRYYLEGILLISQEGGFYSSHRKDRP